MIMIWSLFALVAVGLGVVIYAANQDDKDIYEEAEEDKEEEPVVYRKYVPRWDYPLFDSDGKQSVNPEFQPKKEQEETPLSKETIEAVSVVSAATLMEKDWRTN